MKNIPRPRTKFGILGEKKWLFLLIAAFHISFVQEILAGNPVLVGEHISVGQKVAELVGPGPQGEELYYASYIYEGTGNSFDLVSVDPLTGTMRVYPGPSEEGARGMALGRDGKIYLGTCWSAKIMEFDPQTGIITDRGRPGGGYAETFISEIALGSDGNIYAGTYPNAKLIRYYPTTRTVEDLGKIGEADDQYVHGVVASTHGYVFGGTGSVNAKIVAYRISTGERKVLLESNKPGLGRVYKGRGTDDNVYAKFDDGRMFRLNGFKPPASITGFLSVVNNELSDGSRINMPVGGFGDVTVTRGTTPLRSFPFAYSGKPRFIRAFTTLASGPALYGSGILDFNLFALRENAFANVGYLGGGEAYTMIPTADSTKVLMAAYSGLAPLMVYDPDEVFRPGTNPVFAGVGQIDSSWRPHAMVVLSSGVVVAGGQPGYGKFGGPLVKWNIERNVVETFFPIANESPFSLVAWGNKIIGGTTIKNGTGAPSQATQATLFIWNSESKEVEYATKMPGTVVYSLVEVDEKVYGFCDSKWFRFNLETRELSIRNTRSLWPLDNSATLMPDGQVWGVSSVGIFKADPRLDPQSAPVNPVTVVVSSTALGLPLTLGVAAKGNDLYFASRSKFFKYTIPWAGHHDTTPPTVGLSTPAGGSVFTTSTLLVKSTAHDDVGVAKVWFIHNGVVVSTDTAVPYEHFWPVTMADKGAHSWTARAFDGAGNTAVSPTVLVTVNVDTLAPSVPGGLVVGGKTQALDLSWTASIDVGGSGLAGYRVDLSTDMGFASFVPGWNGREVGVLVATTAAVPMFDTIYYARVRAVDGAGNVSLNSSVVPARVGAFTEDFEIESVGFSPSRWSVTKDNQTNVVISGDVFAGNSGKCAYLTDDNRSGTCQLQYLTGQKIPAFYYRANVRFREKNASHYVLLGNGNATSLYFINAHSDGTWSYYDGAKYVRFIGDTKGYAANTWYQVEVRADLTLGRFNVWVDRVLVGDNIQIPGGNTSLSGIRMLPASAGGVAALWVDDVVLTTTLPFYDNFEGERVGTLPSRWAIFSSGAQTPVMVAPDATATGRTQSVSLVDDSASGYCHLQYTPGQKITAFYYRANVRLRESKSSHYVLLGNGNATSVYFMNAHSDGSWSYYDGAKYVRFAGDTKGYAANTWYQVEILADFATGRFSAWVNSVLVGDNVQIPGANASLSGVRMLPANSSGVGAMWVENVFFENKGVVPSPAAPLHAGLLDGPPASIESVTEGRAYPIPFRPGHGAEGITFDQLPEETPIRIFTIDGRLVKQLSTRLTSAIVWDLTNDEGNAVASGVYLAIMEKNGGRKRLKVIVQK